MWAEQVRDFDDAGNMDGMRAPDYLVENEDTSNSINNRDFETISERDSLVDEIEDAFKENQINTDQYNMLIAKINSGLVALGDISREFNNYKDITFLKNFPNG